MEGLRGVQGAVGIFGGAFSGILGNLLVPVIFGLRLLGEQKQRLRSRCFRRIAHGFFTFRDRFGIRQFSVFGLWFFGGKYHGFRSGLRTFNLQIRPLRGQASLFHRIHINR